MKELVGKTIQNVEKSKQLDDGIKITFTDGSTIEIAFNEHEGFLTLNLVK